MSYEMHEKNVSEALALYDSLKKNKDNEFIPTPGTKRGFTENQILSMAAAISANSYKVKQESNLIESPTSARSAILLNFSDLPADQLGALWLNTKHSFLKADAFFQGSIGDISKDFIKKALENNAAACILVSKPIGSTEPSNEIKAFTERLKEGLALVDIRVVDHFIIGDDQQLSMVENGWM